MHRAVADITASVRARVRRDGVDLAGSGDLAERDVLAAVRGYGPLQPYLDDPEIEELWINQGSRVFCPRAGVSEPLPLRLTETEVRDLVERMLSTTGRRVDLSNRTEGWAAAYRKELRHGLMSAAARVDPATKTLRQRRFEATCGGD